jgi:hypothetical protein
VEICSVILEISVANAYSFSKSSKEIFSVQGVWQSQNMLATMVYGYALRIIT